MLPEDAVLQKRAVIKGDVVVFGQQGAEDGERNVAVLFGKFLEVVGADELVAGFFGEMAVGVVDEGEHAIGPEATDEVELVFHNAAILFFANGQAAMGVIAFHGPAAEKEGQATTNADVAPDENEAGGFVAGVKRAVLVVKFGNGAARDYGNGGCSAALFETQGCPDQKREGQERHWIILQAVKYPGIEGDRAT